MMFVILYRVELKTLKPVKTEHVYNKKCLYSSEGMPYKSKTEYFAVQCDSVSRFYCSFS